MARSLKSLVGLLSLDLLLDHDGRDSAESQEDQDENQNNTCGQHCNYDVVK
jgi:hypothetical protein